MPRRRKGVRPPLRGTPLARPRLRSVSTKSRPR